MNRMDVAKNLVRIASLMLESKDTAEDIATDVATRMDKGMSIKDAMRAVGYANLYPKTRETDMPDGWESLPIRKRVVVLTKAIETLAKEASEKSEAAGGKSYNVKDLFGYWESQVHFLQVEPTDSKPFIVEGKDFKVDVSWTDYKAYSPSSDFQQADPHYTLYTQTSAAAARKLYKILRADPEALKTIGWGAFKNWLDKNGIGCDTQFSVWH
jgi:hypothetical protein